MLTRDEVIAMAKECGILHTDTKQISGLVIDFAAAAYRKGVEDSAAVCQIKTACYGDGLDDMWEHGIDHGRTQCAEEIRALLEEKL